MENAVKHSANKQIVNTVKSLDSSLFKGAALAFSLRKLLSSYTGNCITVRRGSDNQESDIGFVNGFIDIDSLLGFVGSSDGFVKTWYDQSGRGVNATQSVTTRQPKIVTAGALIHNKGKLSLQFDGVDDELEFGQGDNGLDVTKPYYLVNNMADTPAHSLNGMFNILEVGTEGLTAYFYAGTGYRPYTFNINENDTFRIAGTLPRNDENNVISMLFKGGDKTLASNYILSFGDLREVPIDSAFSLNRAYTTNYIGRGSTSTAGWFEGYWQEFILFTKDMVVRQPRIESDLAKFYKTISVGIIHDGNSMTVGTGSTNGQTYPKQLQDLFLKAQKLETYTAFGVSGQTLTQMISDAATQIDPLLTATTDTLLTWGGVNDFRLESGTTKETIYQRYVDYCAARKTAGWKVYAFTMLPQQFFSRTNFENERIWFNDKIKTELVLSIDGVIDVAGDSRIGTDPTDLTYYDADKLHLNNAGYGVVAEVAFNTLKG